jgi:leucyl-tRNA synthetase
VVPAGMDKVALEKAALADEKIHALLESKTIKKTIVVPGKMVNFVIG